jgi:regulator of sirC expression with transglutaminase-like and TPR domain
MPRAPGIILRVPSKGRSMQFIETEVSEDFTREVALPEPAMNLARAGLLFAQAEYPQLDCEWYLGQLDFIARDISARSNPDSDLATRLAVMNEYLFGDLGYAGNMDNYYDPRNSYLNEVIDRRIGLPITLSIVFLELAQRVGLRARGISFPGHFLVAVSEGNGDIIVDAFDGGVCLPRATFIERLQERAEANTSLAALESALAPASKTDILLRQLRNLKAVYVEQGEADKSLTVANHMLMINPDLVPELLERAALYNSLGYSRGAVMDYERALLQIPDGELHTEIRERMVRAKEHAQHLH